MVGSDIMWKLNKIKNYIQLNYEDIKKIKGDLLKMITEMDIIKQENINLSHRIKELEKNASKNRK